ncbi:hypothetical protein [Pontibacter sp. H249]|uniref:hypothetical protein n=1 Tax=Pontibacter sp. H249 TaxID=3133420 RepID=UPI0030BB7576
MIIPSNSLLRHPPLKLKPEQVVIFNAIRYSIDFCDVSYKRLLKSLTELADKGTIENQDFSSVLLDVWSIINYCVIFRKVLCRSFNISVDEPYLSEINKAKNLRDTNQHLDERVEEILSLKDLPVSGSLSWLRIHPKTQKLVRSAIYSGTFTNKIEASIPVSNRIEKELHDEIHRVEFTCVVREGKKGNHSYREESILINTIMSELIWWVAHLEVQIEVQFRGHEITKRHLSDFIIQVGN